MSTFYSYVSNLTNWKIKLQYLYKSIQTIIHKEKFNQYRQETMLKYTKYHKEKFKTHLSGEKHHVHRLGCLIFFIVNYL